MIEEEILTHSSKKQKSIMSMTMTIFYDVSSISAKIL